MQVRRGSLDGMAKVRRHFLIDEKTIARLHLEQAAARAQEPHRPKVPIELVGGRALDETMSLKQPLPGEERAPMPEWLRRLT